MRLSRFRRFQRAARRRCSLSAPVLSLVKKKLPRQIKVTRTVAREKEIWPRHQARRAGLQRHGMGKACMPHFSEHLLRRLKTTTPLDSAEIAAIEHLPVMIKKLPGQAPIVREGQRPGQCCLLIEGFACRSK